MINIARAEINITIVFFIFTLLYVISSATLTHLKD